MSGSEYEASADESEPIQYEDAKRFKLAFGKCQGKRLAFLIKTQQGRNYLRYLLKWDQLRDNTRRNIESVLQHHESRKS